MPVLFAVLLLALIQSSRPPQSSGAAAPPPPGAGAESLTVTNGEVTLAGTLTWPEPARGTAPAVVLISGSGPHTRDEDVFGFKVFVAIADHLTRQEKLRTVAGIDADRIGLVGHSEGGTVAAIAAARSTDVAFIVMLAGTAVPGDQVLRQQARDIAAAGGATPAQVDRIIAAHRAVTDGVLRGAGSDEQLRALRALVEAQLDAAPAAAIAALGDRAAYVDRAVQGAAGQMASPWMKFMLSFDPAPSLRTVTRPVYAAFGELDTQVPPSLHEAPMREALRRNARATIVVYPGANHLFQRARSGQVAEYATLERALIPGLLDDIARWILAVER